jgi:hypothetical protein
VSEGAVGDDADVDAGQRLHEALGEGHAQARGPAGGARAAHEDVGGPPLARDSGDRVGNVVAGIDDQVRAEDGGELAQRL